MADDNGLESLLQTLIGGGGAANFSMSTSDLMSLLQMLGAGGGGTSVQSQNPRSTPSPTAGMKTGSFNEQIGKENAARTGIGGGMGGMDMKKLVEKLKAAQVPLPDWAKRAPTDTTELLRQLSANVGQMAMPGGPVGSVTQGPYGSGQAPQMGFDPATYGQGNGEATFFQQSMQGGMTPIAGLAPLGVPMGWNPFGTSPATKDDKKKDGGGGGGNDASGSKSRWTPPEGNTNLPFHLSRVL